MNFSISKIRAELKVTFTFGTNTCSGETKIEKLTLVLGRMEYFGI